jgi:hypothetical protein
MLPLGIQLILQVCREKRFQRWLRNEVDKDATAIWGFGVVVSLLPASCDALLPVTHLQLEMAEAALRDGVGSVVEGVEGGTPHHTFQILAHTSATGEASAARGNMMVPIHTMFHRYNTLHRVHQPDRQQGGMQPDPVSHKK